MAARDPTLLVLWNASLDDPATYNHWHTREHVPQRLTLPGFAAARRYVRTGGALPQYLTLYFLERASALATDEYRDLLERPTEMSRRMRGGLTDVLRFSCMNLQQVGQGIGGLLAVKLFSALSADQLLRQVRVRQDRPGINAIRVGDIGDGAPDLPFEAPAFSLGRPMRSLLLVEGYDADVLEEGLASLDADLAHLEAPSDWSIYRLAFLFENERSALHAVSEERSHARAS